MTPVPKQRPSPRTPAFLGWTALLILLLAGALMSVAAWRSLADARAADNRARAELLAQSVGQRIDRALAFGIPLARLAGVPALLQQRIDLHADIENIEVLDAAGAVLWSAQRKAAVSQALHAASTTVGTPVVSGGRSVASVRLRIRGPGFVAFLRDATLPMLAGSVVFALWAWAAAVLAWRCGPMVRDRALRFSIADIEAGRFDRLTLVLQRRVHDLRVQRLARAVREVQEIQARARRLVGSLRQTEPQAERRNLLDQRLAEAEGGAVYPAAAPLLRRVFSPGPQAAWLGLLAGASCTLVLAAMFARAGLSAAITAALLALLAAVVCQALTRRRTAPAMSSALAGLLTLVLAGLLPLAWSGRTGLSLAAALAGAGLGLTIAATTRLRQVLQARPDDLWPENEGWMAWAGWLLGLAVLGPALALLLWFGAGLVAPGLGAVPAVLGLLGLSRWGATRSPWRGRPAPRGPDVP